MAAAAAKSKAASKRRHQAGEEINSNERKEELRCVYGVARKRRKSAWRINGVEKTSIMYQ